MRIKPIHTIAALAGLALIGTGGAAASAQSGGGSAPANATSAIAEQASQPGGGPAAFGGGAMMDTAAEYLGLTRNQLLDRVRSGQTLAQVAAAQGKSVDGLVDAIVAAIRKELDQKVAEGTLTAAQRDQIAGDLEARITEMVNNGRGASGAGPGSFQGWGVIDTAAAYLGLTKDQLIERVRGGQTLAQIAVAQGKSVDGLIDALVAAAKAQLDQKVADGTLTAAQRDQIVGQLAAGITDLVNNGRGARGGGAPSGAPSGVGRPSDSGRPSGAGPSGALSGVRFFAGV
jgi:hypothetical protein